MVQRTPPQSKSDDSAFPVRVLIAVPERGFQLRLGDMNNWLDREVGRGNYAHHGSGRRLPDASAFYFRTTEAAFRFTEAFPDLALDDRSHRAPF